MLQTILKLRLSNLLYVVKMVKFLRPNPAENSIYLNSLKCKIKLELIFVIFSQKLKRFLTITKL